MNDWIGSVLDGRPALITLNGEWARLAALLARSW